jgi:translation initiation factor IF-2
MDGSIEAIADSLHKLSEENITINIIHKSVGQIIESDILLAAAANSIIIGFNVKPSINAKKLAEKENVKIYTYNIIYDAIDKIKSIILNNSSNIIKEKIIGTAEIREVFNLNKSNNIYGCIVNYGKIIKNMKIRIKKNNKCIHEGHIKSLKRFKEDVKEINKGYECGIVIKNFNNASVGDTIECYQ